ATVTGPINLGNPTEVTIRGLADWVVRLTRSAPAIVNGPLPTDDPMQRRPDISKARALLGWEPQVQLEKGPDRTIAYFRSLLPELEQG
ncbi:MAG: SDR family NAD-dependent epimerase/dehydratase, partial [Pseudomonadota bacterium]